MAPVPRPLAPCGGSRLSFRLLSLEDFVGIQEMNQQKGIFSLSLPFLSFFLSVLLCLSKDENKEINEAMTHNQGLGTLFTFLMSEGYVYPFPYIFNLLPTYF